MEYLSRIFKEKKSFVRINIIAVKGLIDKKNFLALRLLSFEIHENEEDLATFSKIPRTHLKKIGNTEGLFGE